MELRHLEHFLAVAEEQSFTRAASRIHLGQSALSVSIRSLEHEFGVQLFDRTTHRVELTDSGRALLVEARRTLDAADAARDAVAAVSTGMRGTVRIGIMQSLTLIDLAALLTRYHRERPQVHIVPMSAQGGSAELAREVAEGRTDLAFTALTHSYPAGVSVVPLASESMALACAPDHAFAQRRRIRLAELEGERFVDFPPGWGARLNVDRLFLDNGLRREIVVEVGDTPTVIDLVSAGFGVAFLSPSLVRDTSRVVLRQVRPRPSFAVSLITPSDRPPSAAAAALIDLIRASYPVPGPHR